MWDLVFSLKDNNMELSTSNEGIVDPDPNETHRFEHLRNELVELERRVQRSTYKSENDEVHLKYSITLTSY